MGLKEKLENLFSDREQLVTQNQTDMYNSQEPKAVHELHMGDTTVRLNVPVRYTRMDDKDAEYAPFREIDQAKLFFCRIEEAYEDEGIEEFMQDELEVEVDRKDKSDIAVQCEFLQGRMYYYYVYPFKSGLTHYQKLYAACDLGAGKFYTVETTWLGRKEELRLESLLPFLEFELLN